MLCITGISALILCHNQEAQSNHSVPLPDTQHALGGVERAWLLCPLRSMTLAQLTKTPLASSLTSCTCSPAPFTITLTGSLGEISLYIKPSGPKKYVCK